MAAALANSCSRDGFDDAVALLHGLHCLLVADRVADLNGGRQCRVGVDRLFLRKTVAIAPVERVGLAGLGGHQPRHLVDDAQVHEQPQPLVQRADIAQIADRNHDPVRHFPIELAHDLDSDRLLALDADTVHRVGQVQAAVLGDLAHDTHAAVKVGVQGQHVRAVGQRLHKLRRADLALGQEDDGGDAGAGCVGRQRGARVACAGAGNRAHRAVACHHLFHDADQDGHPQVFEAAGMAVAAQLDPQIAEADLVAQTFRPDRGWCCLRTC